MTHDHKIIRSNFVGFSMTPPDLEKEMVYCQFLSLALQVYITLFVVFISGFAGIYNTVRSLGFLAVDEIKKHLFGLA